MAKADTRNTIAGGAKRPDRNADVTGTGAGSLRTHDITLQVGASIVIDPAGETLVIKKIDADSIIFEQNPSEPEFKA